MRLIVLDVSNPAAPRDLGVTSPFPHFVEGVVVTGRYAYVAAGGAGLRVVDVSDPTSPAEVGSYDTPGYSEAVAVGGNYVFLADGPYGLRIIDVSNPRAPVEAAAVFVDSYVFDVALTGGRAFLAGAGAGLLVADVTDPQRPRELGTADTPGHAYGVTAEGDFAYVADGWEGVCMFRLSDPRHPSRIGCFRTSGWAFGVRLVNRYLYVADSYRGVSILDVSNPMSIRTVGRLELEGAHAARITVAGDVAYVADRNSGLHVVAISDPNNPRRLGEYRQPPFVDALVGAGGYAYVAAGPSGMYVVDMSVPTHPRLLGVHETQSYATSVAVAGHYTYVATTTPPGTRRGLHVVDVRDPRRPAGVGYLRDRGGAYRDSAVAGTTVYLATEDGLQLVDVSVPSAPRELGYISLIEWPQGDVLTSAVGVTAVGSFAYVACERGGLKIIDVSKPSAPRVAGTVRWPNAFAQDVTVSGGFAYVADFQRIVVVDVRDPARPVVVGEIEAQGVFAESVSYAENQLTVAGGSAGIWLLALDDPRKPTTVALVNTPGYALETHRAGNLLYVADFDAGLVVISADRRMTGRSAWLQPEPNDFAGLFYSPVSALSRIFSRSRHTLPEHADVHTRSSFVPRHAFGSWAAATECTVRATGDEGPATLRWCLENIREGGTVRFDPTVFPPSSPSTIRVLRPLPPLEQGRVTIDGSQAGVILDGSGAPEGTSGLRILSSGNVVKGLHIVNFPRNGIEIQGASSNRIGGQPSAGAPPLGEGNLLSGNGGAGILLIGQGCERNLIIGNLIGTDRLGRRAWGNGWQGVMLGAGCRLNRVESNLVSGNRRVGVDIQAGARGNTVAGNLIGTDIEGEFSLANGGNGIFITGSENVIGGDDSSHRNVVSGNLTHGIGFIGEDAQGNQVIGNFIGCDKTGTKLLSNGDHGVALEMGASANLVTKNVIATTGRCAVIMNDWRSSYNRITGNILGTNAAGTTEFAPGAGNVCVGMGAAFNLIGGTQRPNRNVIVGSVYFGRHAGYGNLLLGNYIGLNASGTNVIASRGAVELSAGSRRVFVGGTTAEEGNLISFGRWGEGVRVGFFVDDQFIAGNYIGTDAAGLASWGNRSGGVTIAYGERNVVQGNVIAHGLGAGVRLVGGSSNVVRSNRIYGNQGGGLVLSEGANRDIEPPRLLAVTEDGVWGGACPRCDVQIFSDDWDQGRWVEGWTRADARGAFHLRKSARFNGRNVTAIATDLAGNTSAFSRPRLILPTAGPLFNLSAASYLGEALAPESVVAVFGSGLAPLAEVAQGLPLPTSLAGTTVTVTDAAGSERMASLYFVSPGQINYVMPAGTAVGAATVLIANREGVVHRAILEIARVSPGLFSVSGTGAGLAAAAVLRVRADGTRVREPVTGPIEVGADGEQVYVELYATGVRHRTSLEAVRVRIGDQMVSPQYAGPQGEYPGLDQVNVLLPASLRGRGDVDVSLLVEGKVSNAVRLYIR